jgi:hypothetical protein
MMNMNRNLKRGAWAIKVHILQNFNCLAFEEGFDIMVQLEGLAA